MDILVPEIWLRDFLKTKATPKEIQEYLSLCGPSVERVHGEGNDRVYEIEITTNRVDSAGIYGIAREANAILPRFGVQSSLVEPKSLKNFKLTKTVPYLKASVDHKLCPRFSAVLVKNVTIKASPAWLQERLKLVGVRPINNVVDISNYIMHELGQPVHTFDYDKIEGHKMVLRESRKGEKLTTLDDKTHTLHGGDIVIEDGKKRLIDLAGIMGGANSRVDEKTKNVLLFVQTYDPVKIRRTSMSLAARSEAAVLFEKTLDPEQVPFALQRGIELLEKLSGGKANQNILDLYPSQYKTKVLEITKEFIENLLGVPVENQEVVRLLSALGFESVWQKNTLKVQIPSHRSHDVEIPEDVVEEIARIYGYHNLPSLLMEGSIPTPVFDAPFEFENKIRGLLSGWGASEIYTSSLVPNDQGVSSKALRLKNPLGSDGTYLRMSLIPSLKNAMDSNKHISESVHLFEIANVYIPKKNELPKEIMMLAGMFTNTNYRKAKGILEYLLSRLGVTATFSQTEENSFAPSKHIVVSVGKVDIGQFGVHASGQISYEFVVEALRQNSKSIKTFTEIPKYPAQVEDITIKLPEKTKVGEVITGISSVKLVSEVSLKDVYKGEDYTFSLSYISPDKTLTDDEVTIIRKKVLDLLEKKFGGVVKS